MKKRKYLMNGFKFQYNYFEKELCDKFDFTFLFPEPRRFDFIQNYLLYQKWQRQGKIRAFDIIHINNWENFLNFRKIPGQISIAESHGFHLGVHFRGFLKDEEDFFRRNASYVMERLLSKKIREKINEFDIYYCSTPDMVSHIKRAVRKDVKWLPNAIDTKIFTPNGPKKKLTGNPAIFFPTRLHGDKKPEVGIGIFRNHIKKMFPEATLHLIKQPINDQYDYWRTEMSDPNTYFWHNYLPKDELAKFYRGADLVLGQFSIGTCGLIELQTMACGTPVVTYDRHELKTYIPKLPELALKILSSKSFSRKYANKNLRYVRKVHGAKTVCQTHLRNLEKI